MKVSDTEEKILNLKNKLSSASGKELMKIHYDLAMLYSPISIDDSINHLEIAIKLAQNNKDTRFQSELLQEIAMMYLRKSEYETALEYLDQSIDICENFDDKKGLAISKRLLGILFGHINSFEKALNFTFEALKLEKSFEPKNELTIAGIYNNIAIIFRLMHKYDDSLKYHFKALEIRKKLNDPQIGSSYNNIGIIYELLNKNELALEYIIKSFNLNKKKANNSTALINNYTNLGNLYTKLKRYEEAEKALLKGMEIAEKFGAMSKSGNLHYNLYELYSELGDYKKALEHHIKYSDTTEKIFNRKLNEKLAKIEFKNQLKVKEKEAEIYRLKNIELKKANASKDRFFSIVAHDLKSPFAVIISFIHILKNGFDRYDKKRILSMIDELDISVNNTFKLLENLLEWSRMQSGVIKYNPKKFDINILIQSVIRQKRQNASQKGIKLSSKFETNEQMIFADRNMIETVVRNLVNNAIKFTPTQGEITVSSKVIENNIKISVKDTGVGISEKNLSRLFKIDSNFSTYGTNNEKGTGLGLILCKEFVEKNHGNIFVQSKEGIGTEFYFLLPANA